MSSDGTRTQTPRSRLAQARGYHPRGRTIGEDETDDARPALRVLGGAGTTRGTGSESAASRRTGAESAAVRRTASDPGTSGRTASSSRRTSARNVGWASRTSGLPVVTARSARPGGPTLRRVTVTRPAPPLARSGPRLRQITAVIVLVFAVIAIRLIDFQIREAPDIAARGLADRLLPVDLPAPRGSIYDRNMAELAGSAEARYVSADPSRVEDPAAAADALSPLLGVPRSQLLPLLTPHTFENGEAAQFEYLARGVSVATGELVSALGLRGIYVRYDEARTVPGHDLGANLIGFTGRDLQGLAGLEETYDHILAGVEGHGRYEVGLDAANLGQEIPGGYREEVPARPGSSLQLTIDRDLQFEIQRVLGAAMERANAFTGSAVVLDVRTGEVLAQASYPFYDAANPFASDAAVRGDMASSMLLDPGSVHKAIVFAACLQEGVVAPNDTVALPTTLTRGVTTFHDSHTHPPMANFTLPGILAWSSNVGTILLADQLGADRLYEYQRAFGLGEFVGEGLPGEVAGLVQPPQNWSADAHGTIPIGLGVSVTPLQMAAVYATIANGGTYVQPHLVQAIIDPDGAVTPMPAPVTRQVISAENAAALRTMLEAVVTAPDATGLTAAIDGYRVAGKTGTGLVVVDGHYAEGEVASFIGMAPADAPRYVVAVFAHTPGGSGGAIAGPAFAEMMEQTLRHYRVAPTGTRPPSFTIFQ